MNQGRDYLYLKDPETRRALVAWWHSLDDDRGARARLRRAQTPDDVLLTEPFFAFLARMPDEWSKPENLLSSTLVAAALSHVRENSEKRSFAAKLASPKEGDDRARVSELRFQQLQKSDSPGAFFRRLLRAIRLAGNNVNIGSLADSILHWMREYRFGVDREPRKRLAVRWANDYYTSIQK